VASTPYPPQRRSNTKVKNSARIYSRDLLYDLFLSFRSLGGASLFANHSSSNT
jgi:hypothetical protein